MEDDDWIRVLEQRRRTTRDAVSTDEWAARVDLAACYRLAVHYRMTDMIYNHISMRVPGTHDQFLINAFGLLYEEVTASNLVKIDVDGRVLDADVVLVGVGASPAVDWLRSSGLDLSHGVVCDSHGATNAPGVWAVGDCSAWYDPTVGGPHRVEHWTDSRERPAVAVRALLHGPEAEHPALRAPYFWSDQYGVRIQFAGHRLDSDELVVEDGTAEDANLLATWRRDGRVVAVLGLNQVRAFTRHRKALSRTAVPA